MANQLRLNDGQREWTATVDGSSVTIDGIAGAFVIAPRPDGRWTITHEDRILTASAERTPQRVWTGIDGTVSEWQAQPASARTRHKAADDDVTRKRVV